MAVFRAAELELDLSGEELDSPTLLLIWIFNLGAGEVVDDDEVWGKLVVVVLVVLVDAVAEEDLLLLLLFSPSFSMYSALFRS